MKRNFLLAIAVTALMVTSTIAQAADVTFGGEFRPRVNLDRIQLTTPTPLQYLIQEFD